MATIVHDKSWQYQGGDGLPLWDTFEAGFFFAGGIFIGIVFGFLLPSLWRSLRRRFRNVTKYAPAEGWFTRSIAKKQVQILSEEDDLFKRENIQIINKFVLARNFIYENNIRESVQIYLEILSDDKVTKHQTNQALFELAQCYAELKLYDRAVDTSIELLARKNKNELVFQFCLEMTKNLKKRKYILKLLNIYKGSMSNINRKNLCLSILNAAESEKSSSPTELLQIGKQALIYDISSAKAKFFIWDISSLNLWNSKTLDLKNTENVFFEDLNTYIKIVVDSDISPMAAFDRLFFRFSELKRLACKNQDDWYKEIEKISENFFDHKLRPLSFFILNLLFIYNAEKNRFIFDNNQIFSSSVNEKKESFYFWKKKDFLDSQNLSKLLNTHFCTKCDSIYKEFLWECPYCHEIETFKMQWISFI